MRFHGGTLLQESPATFILPPGAAELCGSDTAHSPQPLWKGTVLRKSMPAVCRQVRFVGDFHLHARLESVGFRWVTTIDSAPPSPLGELKVTYLSATSHSAIAPSRS